MDINKPNQKGLYPVCALFVEPDQEKVLKTVNVLISHGVKTTFLNNETKTTQTLSDWLDKEFNLPASSNGWKWVRALEEVETLNNEIDSPLTNVKKSRL